MRGPRERKKNADLLENGHVATHGFVRHRAKELLEGVGPWQSAEFPEMETECEKMRIDRVSPRALARIRESEREGERER